MSKPPRSLQRSKNREPAMPRTSLDRCRRRKIRCDGSPSDRCTNCRTFNSTCTYMRPTAKRGPAHVSITDAQKENIELKIQNATLEQENETLKRENASLRSENVSIKATSWSRSLCTSCRTKAGSSDSHSVFQQDIQDSSTPTKPSTEDDPSDELASRLGQFSLDSIRIKFINAIGPLTPEVVMHSRRRLFWDMLPWEKDAHNNRPQYSYPDSDLVASLLQLYFTNVHPTIPVLHRPSFEQSVAEGLHLVDFDFGGLLLSVLSVASRYSDDSRVFVDGDTSLSSGWKFANQIEIQFVRQVFEPKLYEVQMCCLLALFTLGTSFPEMSTAYMALGISFLQLRSEYRQKRREHQVNFEDELWKKVFWSYQLLQMGCVFRGSPTSFNLDVGNVDLPLEVDEEYWDRGFAQPLGKLSVNSYFLYHSRLCEILGDTMQRLYGSEKTKIRLGWDGPDWEYRTVAGLDSAMNAFSDSIPSHLRWNPDSPPQDIFFDQSAILNVSYYHIQLMIHRPFIRRMSAFAVPSLYICVRAARTILQTADIWLSKRQRQPMPSLVTPVFVSGMILGLHLFGVKRANPSADVKKDLAHLETAMKILKFVESRSQSAGRLWELLRELRALDPLSTKFQSQGAAASAAVQELISVIPASALDGIYLRCDDHDVFAHLKPGVSIEQLLSDTAPFFAMDTIFDDELLPMWIDIPDVASVSHRDSHLQNRTVNYPSSLFLSS
ncbi:hypothetical protein C8F04DRAFT_1070952 [Mycena alexandri]|uniref:Zn(2)-C6 fungal-type domain-containing protein n=1 Tax=Mycena alexandri TaxID=1745969 RepID=A0AAD6TDZ2_9AGAR|nr:hypothetical protein C8F04DRAFT_1070952 [Mycena alexandri]